MADKDTLTELVKFFSDKFSGKKRKSQTKPGADRDADIFATDENSFLGKMKKNRRMRENL